MQIFFLSSFHLLTTANVAAAAAEPATERGVAIHAEYVGSTCVANGCKRTTSITPGIYCSSCLLPPIGNRAVITAKLDVDHVYQCGSGSPCCDYKTVSYCIAPETNNASEIRRGVSSIVRGCASAVEE
ncbi:hypothetical protein VE00_03427 [Pseudogymnoascus sp. WSF 3629]|nr:hypothetical protein VE00_03427 [Pseudogymnoascus sp. WSF 3629]